MMIVLPVVPFAVIEGTRFIPQTSKNQACALGKRRESLARFACLQALAKQRAFPTDLSRDLIHVAHQCLGVVQ